MTVINYKYKFVFVKTRKVAGTSVQALLRNFCQENDIVTAVTPRDEHYSINLGNYSRNYLKDSDQEKYYTELCSQERYEDAIEHLASQEKILSSHTTSEKIREILYRQGKNPDDFYFFTIDRHPYSYMLSRAKYSNYLYNKKGVASKSLSESQINSDIGRMLDKSGFDKEINQNFYINNNVLDVDKVIRFEELKSGIMNVLEHLNLNANLVGNLPTLKKSVTVSDPASLLSIENKQKIQSKFEKTFDILSYEK